MAEHNVVFSCRAAICQRHKVCNSFFSSSWRDIIFWRYISEAVRGSVKGTLSYDPPLKLPGSRMVFPVFTFCKWKNGYYATFWYTCDVEHSSRWRGANAAETRTKTLDWPSEIKLINNQGFLFWHWMHSSFPMNHALIYTVAQGGNNRQAFMPGLDIR